MDSPGKRRNPRLSCDADGEKGRTLDPIDTSLSGTSSAGATTRVEDASPISWPVGGGAMGVATRAFDWASTPLGPPDQWPLALRIVTGICLNSRYPMFIWWGPELINIYNDAYAPMLGRRHPEALGRSAREVWRDVWPAIAPQVDAVLERGEPSWQERLRLVLNRNGYDEPAYFTYSHSPIFDENGKVGGVLCVVSEETAHVLAEQRQTFLLQLSDTLRRLTDARDIVSAAVGVLGRHLGANRVGYGTVQPDDQTIVLDTCFAEGVTPLTGSFPMSSFGAANIALQRKGITVVHNDVNADHANNPATWKAIDTRSFVSVPLVRDGRFCASLFVNQQETRNWTAEEVALIEEVAARIWDALERARANDAGRQAEERLTFALEASGGVGAWDWDVPNDRLYCNARFAELFSVNPERAAAGAPFSEYMQGVHPEDRVEAALKVSAATAHGGDYSAEYRALMKSGAIRWLYARGRAQLGPDGKASRFTGVVFDITDRKLVALRDAFLVRLDDATRRLDDPSEITQTAARLLREHLDVNRCAYADVEDDEDTFNLTGDSNRDVPSIVGRYTFTQFGAECLRLMRAGEPYSVEDSEVDPRTAEVREAYRATRIRAVICVPVMKQGRFVAGMAVHQTTPRAWRCDEVETLQMVASRCWESIERARVSRELSVSQERLRALVHGTYEYIGLLTPAGIVLEVNSAALTFGNFKREDILGRVFWETGWWTNTPGAAEVARQAVHRAAKGEFIRTEFALTRPSGEVITFDFSLHPIKNEAGEVIYVVPEGRNINDRKQAEAALSASESKYRTLFESIDEGYCLIEMLFDEQGKPEDYRFIEANPAFEKHTGLTGAIGKTIREMVPGHDAHWFEIYGNVARSGEAVRFVSHADAMARWFDVYAFRIGPPEKCLVAILFTDITSQKQGEVEREHLLERIDAERLRLQQVFLQAPVAIVVLRGPQFVVELANPSYQGFVRGRDLIGKPFGEAVPELGRDVWDAFHYVMDTGQPFVRSEFYVPYDQDGDGVSEEHWFNVLFHPLRELNGSVSGIVIVATEATAQVIARKELERTNRELEEFAYVASHDLQEPLRMVNIYTQLLLRDFQANNPEAQNYAAFIHRGVKRMEDLIRDLLSYSRAIHRDGPEAQVADLSESLAQALASVNTRLAETGAKVSAGPLPEVRGDTAQLTHVFQNLLSNSMKYREPDVAPEIHIAAEHNGDHWVVSVRDNGIGFEQQYAERIFGLFKRLHKDEYSGTGLGLAICQRIVERYGGRMWAESSPGRGATFYFSLPDAAAQ